MATTEVIRQRYNRTALFYDYMDKMIKDEVRKKLIEQAYGQVLEVGVGTGKNLKFYRPDCQVTGIDFSPAMLKKAREKVRGRDNISLLEMDAQELDFPDNSFDTIVATCVFCSVPDPVKGLEELKRVCKPKGQLLFLEHIRSSNLLMGTLMDLFNPLVVRLVGANINRETLVNIETAGLCLQQVDSVGTDILKYIVAAPNKD